MPTIIKEREDIIVYRSGGQDSAITKNAKTRDGALELANEHRFLTDLEGLGITPQVFSADVSGQDGVKSIWKLTMSDVGDSHEITDEYAFRTHFIRMLYALRRKNISHGDLTSANIRIIDNKPYLIDWGESRYTDEERPDKRPEGDTYHAWKFASQWPDGARVARRWYAIYNAVIAHFGPNLPITMLDCGCFHGDIAAAASAAGWDVNGIDIDHHAVDVATARWSSLPVQFHQGNVLTTGEVWRLDVVTALSMFPYVEDRWGVVAAKDWIRNLIDNAGLLFFETQLAGDGPGPQWLPGNDQVRYFLEECGGRDIENICEIPLPGRDTTRTVFKVVGKGTT